MTLFLDILGDLNKAAQVLMVVASVAYVGTWAAIEYRIRHD